MRQDGVPIWVYRGVIVLLLAVVGYFLSALHVQQQRDHDLLIELKTEQRIQGGELTYMREAIRRIEEE